MTKKIKLVFEVCPHLSLIDLDKAIKSNHLHIHPTSTNWRILAVLDIPPSHLPAIADGYRLMEWKQEGDTLYYRHGPWTLDRVASAGESFSLCHCKYSPLEKAEDWVQLATKIPPKRAYQDIGLMSEDQMIMCAPEAILSFEQSRIDSKIPEKTAQPV